LNQSLEKIVIIGLNLTLLVTIGVPLLITTTNVLSQSEQAIAFQQFVQDIDELILTADHERIFLTTQIFVPANLTLEAVNNQLIFKIYLENWHIVTRTYRCSLQISGLSDLGYHQLSVNATESIILITFQRI
jgi:hypothetical protein